ncbi:aspartate kinase [Myxococcota bacterium]|nr:aspartate kinase [Myxococcota bacterium]
MENNTVVMKFGGSSLADNEKIMAVADLVTARRAKGERLVVVVSANGKTTDHLLAQARAISKNAHKRELDMLLTAGERVSMALLAMAIKDRGFDSISFTGSQCGIITTDNHANARIIEVRPFRVEDELQSGKIVIVAGFQGVSYKREITTLGRGGSDTTAVALAAALNARACEIYSDVDGVYSADPRIVDPFRLEELSYEEMMELAYRGAKVLNAHAVKYAQEKGVALYARATAGGGESVIRRDRPSGHDTMLSVTQNLGCCLAKFSSPLDNALEGLRIAEIPVLYCSESSDASLVVVKPHMEQDLEQISHLGLEFSPVVTISMVGRCLDMTVPWIARARQVLRSTGVTELVTEAGPSHLTFYVGGVDASSAVKALHGALVGSGKTPGDAAT